MLPREAVLDDTGHLDDFAPTAGLLGQLDMLVTVDTAVAHLGGAMGVPTLLLLKKNGRPFYPKGRDDTPWYPSMRIARQQVHGDWSEPLRRTGAAIERRAAGVAWPACFDAG